MKRLRKELDRHFPLDHDGVRRSEDGSTAVEIDGNAPQLSKCDVEKISVTSRASVHDLTGYAWRLEFDGPADSPYEGTRLALLVRFTTTYPMERPIVTATGLIPAHIDIDPDGVIGCSCPASSPFFCNCQDWSPTILTARDLINHYRNLLAQITLVPEEGLLGATLNRPLAEAFIRDGHGQSSEYWITAAGSVNGRVPRWSSAIHASFPPVVRARVRAIVLTLRTIERRASQQQQQQQAADSTTIANQPLVWPCQPLPDDALHSIIAHVVADLWADPTIQRAVRFGQPECRYDAPEVDEQCLPCLLHDETDEEEEDGEDEAGKVGEQGDSDD